MSGPRRVLLGPTASGKTAVSLFLARRLDAEIISVDSRQIYKGMEIGSAAATVEERARVPHHLVAEIDPFEPVSAGEFGRRSRAAETEIEERGKRALLVGGSGLYLRAAVGGLDELPRDEGVRGELRERLEREGAEVLHAELAAKDPESAELIAVRDGQRITRALEILTLTGEAPSTLRTRGREAERAARIAVLDRPREELEQRIRLRVNAMVEAGLEYEVRSLLLRGLDPESTPLKSVGFAETIRFLNDELTREEWIEEIAIHTRRLAKRQRTWFRGLDGAVRVPVGAEESEESVGERVYRVLMGLPG